ncbi:MAG: ABC transporter substrate-binding protein [Rhodospirillaceae bacterium]|jgi:phospholipid transport system substrate-binding protein|nr:ABC transporter substrate-binding protein [Rhodospirillaceae bacterium]MBT4691184.1 ABC transporter substrate-binding protein [Rhodospirillaceae bacterium]MBT5081099.1 ABC transporter substrate-binding protein [Rhodospirillaceae bacterium]MBT5524626.1 ABC transporter substrate-binding protein [Rhodospirillaceae bacterium]MBT5879876.1 ABC transporter substrate-binding protein [Rhodospirillaceae bacterium]
MAKIISRRLACLFMGIAMTGAAFAVPTNAVLASESQPADPEAFMRTLAADALVLLTDDNINDAKRARDFRKLLRRDFDLPAVGKFVLGRYWRRANVAEQQEFVALFEDYIVAIYGRRLGVYGSAGMTVTGNRADGKDGVIVHTKIAPPKGPVIQLDWRLKNRDGGWRVVDIMVEGVSLALAQRSEFASVIRSNGGRVAGLLQKLRIKSATLALNQDSSNQDNLRQNSSVVRTQ